MHPSCAHSLERAITTFVMDARVSLNSILLPMLRIFYFGGRPRMKPFLTDISRVWGRNKAIKSHTKTAKRDKDGVNTCGRRAALRRERLSTHTHSNSSSQTAKEAPTSDEVVSDVMSVMKGALNELRALAS